MSKYQIEFIREIMKFKIDETGLATTPACQMLSNQLNKKLSHMTLIKASKGKFTMKTVCLMIKAGWFAMSDFQAEATNQSKYNQSKYTQSKQQNQTKYKTQTPQITSEFEVKFKTLIQEAFDKGYQNGISSSRNSLESWRKEIHKEGYNVGYVQGLQDGRASGFKDSQYTKAYDEGYKKGRQLGYHEGYSKGFNAAGKSATHVNVPSQNLSIDLVKLRSVFELSKRGATDGEKTAARRAASVMLSKWILNEFGDSVQVNIA